MPRSPHTTERRALAFGTASLCLAAFALVIWIKMRVVTAPPRSAYAVPEQQFPTPPKPSIEPSMEESLGVRDVGVVPEHPTGIEPPNPP
jgi:hypothetical protein